jgi:hypothetical protein
LKRVLFLFLVLCICSSGCVKKDSSFTESDGKTEEIIQCIEENTKILNELYQKQRRDKKLDAEAEMNKIQLEKVLIEIEMDINELKKYYRSNAARHLNRMLDSMATFFLAVDEKDLMLFEQGYLTYKNGYHNFMEIVRDRK